MFEDHYQALWVPRDASDDEIKKAYYALARDCHPDLNPKDEAAKKKFQRIQRAFEVLGDPTQREKYNRRYDAKFRKIPAPPPPPPPIPSPRDSQEVRGPVMANSNVSRSPEVGVRAKPSGGGADRIVRRPSSRDSPAVAVMKIVFGGIAGLALGYLTLAMFFPHVLSKEQVYRDPPSQPEPSRPRSRKTQLDRPRQKSEPQKVPTIIPEAVPNEVPDSPEPPVIEAAPQAAPPAGDKKDAIPAAPAVEVTPSPTSISAPPSSPTKSRQPLRVLPLIVGFNSDRVTVPIPVDSLSPSDELVLQIPTLRQLSSTANFSDSVSEARRSQEIVVEFTDMLGAQIGIKLNRSSENSLFISMSYRFKANPDGDRAASVDLTYEQLRKMSIAANRVIADSPRRISQLNAQLSVANRALSAANAMPTSNAKPLQVVATQNKVRNLTNSIQEVNQNVAGAQDFLKRVPTAMAFLQSLEGKRIPFRILVRNDRAELILVDGRRHRRFGNRTTCE